MELPVTKSKGSEGVCFNERNYLLYCKYTGAFMRKCNACKTNLLELFDCSCIGVRIENIFAAKHSVS